MTSWGPELRDDGTARFRLWAPDRDRVTLEIHGGASVAMERDAEGWFSVDAEAGPGTRYRFRLDADLVVPDPASRFQPEDVHGPSEIVDPKQFEWTNDIWCGRPWEEAVIYELHVEYAQHSQHVSCCVRSVFSSLNLHFPQGYMLAEPFFWNNCGSVTTSGMFWRKCAFNS